MYQDVGNPEVLDDVRVDVDLAPGPVGAVVEDHPVLRPPHIVAQPEADLLQDKTHNSILKFLALTFILFVFNCK